jgi:small ubiquitin-related modifier
MSESTAQNKEKQQPQPQPTAAATAAPMVPAPPPVEPSDKDKDKEKETEGQKSTPTATTAAAPSPAAAAAAAPSEHINLKVMGQDGNEVFFKIKKHTALKKLIEAYCQRAGVSATSIRFLFDGRRVQPDQTPKELGMEDGDIIDAMLHQTGGTAL